MNRYEELVEYCAKVGISVTEKEFKSNAKGLCKGNKIAISKRLESAVEKRCILAEEMMHCLYTVGDILDQNSIQNKKQERYARQQAYETLLPLPSFVNAYNNGLRKCYEIAEFLEVTEEFLIEAFAYYERKHGMYAIVHGMYTIRFSPFIVYAHGQRVG